MDSFIFIRNTSELRRSWNPTSFVTHAYVTEARLLPVPIAVVCAFNSVKRLLGYLYCVTYQLSDKLRKVNW